MSGKCEFPLIVDLYRLVCVGTVRRVEARVQVHGSPAQQFYLPTRHNSAGTEYCHRYQSPYQKHVRVSLV
jgi:hypothetical protein